MDTFPYLSHCIQSFLLVKYGRPGSFLTNNCFFRNMATEGATFEYNFCLRNSFLPFLVFRKFVNSGLKLPWWHNFNFNVLSRYFQRTNYSRIFIFYFHMTWFSFQLKWSINVHLIVAWHQVKREAIVKAQNGLNRSSDWKMRGLNRKTYTFTCTLN